MAGRFNPDFRFDSIKDIKADFFIKNNISFVILDIDNTLVGYKTRHADGTARDFLKMLGENGIKFAFASNNSKKRVTGFAREFDTVFVHRAAKPLTFGIRRVMEGMGAKRENTALIGDQVFTDVYAGKRSGITTVLVNPIESKETPFFAVKRYFERLVLKKYNK